MSLLLRRLMAGGPFACQNGWHFLTTYSSRLSFRLPQHNISIRPARKDMAEMKIIFRKHML